MLLISQRVFLRADVLILVHQNPAITLAQRFALRAALDAGQGVELRRQTTGASWKVIVELLDNPVV